MSPSCGSLSVTNAKLHSRLVPNETSALFPTNEDGSRSVDRSWDQQDTWRQMEKVYKSGKPNLFAHQQKLTPDRQG